MDTYSWVRSEPSTTARPPPPPLRRTSTSTTRWCAGYRRPLSVAAERRCALSRRSLSLSSANRPSWKMTSPPMRQTHPSAMGAPAVLSAWPTLPTSRPTLGSLPATADLKSGPLTTALATRAAVASSAAPSTATRMTCSVPSPLRTTCAARSRHTAPSALAKASASGQQVWPLESSATVSLVDSSPSTEMALKLLPTASASWACNVGRPPGTLASVRRKHNIVAMLGSTMPAPLAKPTSRAPPGSSAELTFA
mmetsp:Transcript_81367/g.225304  ORF Transcript_81367/g.225304 Transcript_81367/m.225304 type:complete len:252 (+) Transcript_81367:196-951(+)